MTFDDPVHIAQIVGAILEQLDIRYAVSGAVAAGLFGWYQKGGGTSDRQWRDILGIIKIQAGALDRDYLERSASAAGLTDLLKQAMASSGEDH